MAIFIILNMSSSENDRENVEVARRKYAAVRLLIESLYGRCRRNRFSVFHRCAKIMFCDTNKAGLFDRRRSQVLAA